ncbi:putative RNA-directed DNA polymerase, eukaryota, reverse transcriptase zinc-binding domain protein [Tanacetum coccineum]
MASIDNLKLLLLKVDFVKAFDSVNWTFLHNTMRQIGFGSKWRKWIASCLESASISVLVNGSLTKEFKMERGLRQGDPLSPFLFLIVAEALQVTILKACEKEFYKGLFLSNSGANVSLLQYVDNALFFGDWSRLNAKYLLNILKAFELASGLNVNILKSRIIGVGVPSVEVESLASSLGCSYGSTPFIYLGLPVGKRMRFCDGWSDIITTFMTGYHLGKLRCSLLGADSLLLYALETYKDCKVIERWGLINGEWGGIWFWRCPPRGRALNDLSSLANLLGDFHLSSTGRDKWVWSRDPAGTFNVKNLARNIQNHMEFILLYPAARSAKMPLNTLIIASLICSIWAIWKWRNHVINAEPDMVRKVKDEDIFPFIQRTSKLWISSRLNLAAVNWNRWISRPYDILSSV